MDYSFWVKWIDNKSVLKNTAAESDYLSSFSNLATLLLAFVVVIWMTLKKVISSQYKRKYGIKKAETEESEKQKQKKVIPSYSPFTIRLPLFVETVALASQTKREGVKIIETIYLQYINEPVFKMPLVNDQIMVVKCPSLIQKIKSSTDMHVLNKADFILKYFLPEDLGQSLFGVDPVSWAPHRKMLNRCFTYKAIQSFIGIMNRNGKLLISDLIDYEFSSPKTDSLAATKYINESLYFHALNIISEIVMGEKMFTKEENSSFHTHFIKGKAITTEKIMNPLNTILPWIWWLNPKRKALDHHTSEGRKHVIKGIERCKKSIQTEMLPIINSENMNENGSILQHMIRNNVPEDRMISEVSNFLLAGHETTVTAIKYFLQHIAEHPEMQKLCQEGIDSIFYSKSGENNDENGNVELDMNDLANLKYLERCILESLRITPVIPFTFRQLSAPMEVNGYKFKKDTVLMFPIWAIHRDPNIYPNPGQFDPDRFLPENMKKRSSYTFLPFSHGPRNCIGYKVAIMEMKIILGLILKHFNVLTEDKLKDLRIDSDFTTFPEREFRISLIRRE